MNRNIFAVLLLPFLLIPSARAGWSWTDTEGRTRDLWLDNRIVARYHYEPVDTSSPERRDETYKPFMHVFAWHSKTDYITKGAGGKFPHHRGIFYGFSRCSYTDNEGKEHEKVDTWHCRKAHQVHREFLAERTTSDMAEIANRIEWIGDDGKPFASEERTHRFTYRDGDLVLWFHSKLTPLVPRLTLDGDPQHAGFQFRATNEVSEKTAKQTYYIRPESGKGEPGKTINWSAQNDTEATRDLPWKAMSFVTGGDRYTVLYVDSPSNPKPARHSERDYGRFGSYFVAEATPEEPVEITYRLLIRKGEIEAEEAASLAEELVDLDLDGDDA